MEKRWVELFEGMVKSEIPFDGTGYILATHFRENSNYTTIEIIAFKNVKNFIQGEDDITFYSDGYKIFILYEPISYRFRFQEPFLRESHDSIPLRWKELHTVEMPNHDRVFVSREPYMSYGSFNVEKPDSGNFVFYFYHNEKTIQSMDHFLGKILTDDLKIPKSKVPEVLEHIHTNLENFQKFS